MYNPAKTIEVRAMLNEWLNTYPFTHFLTVRLPIPAYTNHMDAAKRHLLKIVKMFEKSLLGCHWNRYPVLFRGVAELGRCRVWHWHLLLISHRHSTKQLQAAIDRTLDYLHLSPSTIDIRSITHTPEYLNGYCVKEVRVDSFKRFNSDRIIFSEDLFNLPVKLHR